MKLIELQQRLRASGRYPHDIDGVWGPNTKAAVQLAMTDGPDTKIGKNELIQSAERLGLTYPHVKAVVSVESSGAGFYRGRATILFEPHRFSRTTKHAFDKTHPSVSYPKWDRSKYPKSQEARWEQLFLAVSLDVDAGFASASYGMFQILGENYRACGFSTPFDFAEAHAKDEQMQLVAFERFITSQKLVAKLKAKDWAGFAEAYNGTAYKLNGYHIRLAEAYAAAGGA
jgi:hypothetical protein